MSVRLMAPTPISRSVAVIPYTVPVMCARYPTPPRPAPIAPNRSIMKYSATNSMAGTGITEIKNRTETRARGNSTMNAPVTADTAPLAPMTGAPL